MRIVCVFLMAVLASCICVAQGKLYNVLNYGAVADGKRDDAKALQKAIDACNQAGGGTVLIPSSKKLLSGPFELKSNINLHLEANATIIANPDEKIYTVSAFRENKGEGTKWISAEHVTNLSITGTGSIDGNGIAFMGKELEDAYELKPFNILDPRPHVLTIIDGKNIRISDVHIGNSAYWTIHLVGCNDVVISGITLLNSLKVRNSDGIDVDHSRNVRISDCYIESGDDCICLKNRREYEEYGKCENIVVSNCTMTSRSCAIKIGSENMDTIRQVLFNNCIIKKSNRGVGIQNRDEGVVSDVIFSNMIIESQLFTDTWWGKSEPIYVTAFRRASGNHKDANWRFPKGAVHGKVGQVSNIYFTNIKCTGESGIYVGAESDDKITGIYFDEIDVTINKVTTHVGGYLDRRPSAAEGLVKTNTSAFYFENARNIFVRNGSVSWGSQKPSYFAHGLESHNVSGLSITNLLGESANPATFEFIKK